MQRIETENFFESFSKLMDETISVNENDLMETLNEIQLLIDDKLIPSIEEVSYEKKYDLINQIKDISKDIALYLYFPEMINKTIVGIYQPSTYKDLLPMVPSITYRKETDENIKVLNLAENTIIFDKKSYLDLIHLSEKEDVNLSSIVHMISIPSNQVEDGLAYIIIPNGADTKQKYFTSITNLIDVLCVEGKECQLSVISNYCNISQLFIYGKINKRDKEDVESYCNKNNIEIKYLNSLQYPKEEKMSYKKNNFCYIYILENLLYEIIWYLASKKKELQTPLNDINDNLLFKDDISYEHVKKMQIQYKEDINRVEQVYRDYKTIVDELIDKIKTIQEKLNIKEGIDCVNEHISMNMKLLELLIKIEESYKLFPSSESKEIVRNYAKIYSNVTGHQQIGHIIVNDFFGNWQDKEELSVWKQIDTTSPFILRKKIEMYKELKLSREECGRIAVQLPLPLKSIEKRMLGIYFFTQDKVEEAKELLLSAAQNGDEEAGIFLFETCKWNQKELYQLADYGISDAAFQIGKNLYTQDRINALKYLHIAASKSHLKATKLLGDISYDLWKKEANQTARKSPEQVKEALHYYLLAEKYGSEDRKIFEKIGNLYYSLENYKEAISYFEKSDSLDSNYYLGIIYQNGFGCATDEKIALKYFEKAMNMGHLEAQIAYEKLNEKIEARKKKNVASEHKSYQSESYTRGYSSSSGW